MQLLSDCQGLLVHLGADMYCLPLSASALCSSLQAVQRLYHTSYAVNSLLGWETGRACSFLGQGMQLLRAGHAAS